jgi:anti-sigma regulatory factor (Ser/Thr protein kinase)
VPRAAAVETIRFTRMFCGRADQVRQARHEVTRHLSACGYPRVDDAVLIISEFCTNAVLHSDSRGQFLTVRTELFPTYLRVEVEDLGGHSAAGPPDVIRPHGLAIVEALTGMGNWGIEGDETGRVAWATLDSDG